MFFAMYAAACLRFRRSCADLDSIAATRSGCRVTPGIGVRHVGKAESEASALAGRECAVEAGQAQFVRRVRPAMKTLSHFIQTPPNGKKRPELSPRPNRASGRRKRRAVVWWRSLACPLNCGGCVATFSIVGGFHVEQLGGAIDASIIAE